MGNQTKVIEITQVKKYITALPVVYLCAEFAVDTQLPMYAGGLGVLAGDVLSQANDDERSFVGVGLFYRKGYMRQEISQDANIYTEEQVDLEKSQLALVVDNGQPVTITVPIHARRVMVKVWVHMVGDVPLFLLDTDVEGNEAQDVNLCDRLYYGDREHRFKQEMILGIGSVRMIRQLGITPRLYHLNEGHSALMLYELAYEHTRAGEFENVSQALAHQNNVVFTNHTLIPEGNDVFSKDLVISYLSSYAMEFPIDPTELVKFGLIQDSSLFSPTMLALRLSTICQAVSKLHAKKALEVWPDHPMIAVTNGVRQKYWQTSEIREAVVGDDPSLWGAHLKRKEELCRVIKEVTHVEWKSSDLILGWARRLANYKRPLVLFEDIERLKVILSSSPVPVRVVISGKPHAHDTSAIENLRKILELVGQFDDKVVYIQNYTIGLARTLLSGVDVLLNTPVRGFEACGTSGMKASMNGVLQCTTLDGWTDEVEWKDLGWVLGDNGTAQNLYTIIEQEIVPLYTKRDAVGIPVEWSSRMRATIEMATARYNAKRMMDEIERMVYSSVHSAL